MRVRFGGISRVLACVVVFLSACSPDGPSPIPRDPPPPALPGAAGVNGTIYRKSLSGRTPAEGVRVELTVQVQTGRFSGNTSLVAAGYTNSRGEFHVDSAPIGARILVGPWDSSTWIPCMAYIENYQGSATVEIDLYPKTENEEWIIDSVLAGRGPIVTGSATAAGAPQPGGYISFEATYENYTAFSPVDSSGRYAICGLPVNLMFPSRVWIENGEWSCDSTRQNYAHHSINLESPSDYAVRDFDLHRCNWGNTPQGGSRLQIR